jgi:hypothetical protein
MSLAAERKRPRLPCVVSLEAQRAARQRSTRSSAPGWERVHEDVGSDTIRRRPELADVAAGLTENVRLQRTT